MQKFEPESIERTDIGTRLNFKEAVEPARKLVDLYKRLPLSVLEDFPDQQLNQLKSQANSDYNFFDQILKFDETSGSPAQVRVNLIAQLGNAYPNTFQVLYSLIAYGASKVADFERLERDGRAAVQSIEDSGSATMQSLNASRIEAGKILDDIRKVAEEQGVTQEAEFFKKQADQHAEDANAERKRTINWALVLIFVSFGTLFLHKWAWIDPTTAFQMIQIGISKLLIFAVLSFMLYLSARRYLASRHNEVVNRHRQTALQTFQTLANAAHIDQNRDVVLNYAAACIFSPQPTGFGETDLPKAPSATSMVGILGKQFTQSSNANP
jgi:hypothetical protein